MNPIPHAINRQDAGLHIEWDQNGHEGFFPARELRLACPCAACVEEMSGRPLSGPEHDRAGYPAGLHRPGGGIRPQDPLERRPFDRDLYLRASAPRLSLRAMQETPVTGDTSRQDLSETLCNPDNSF